MNKLREISDTTKRVLDELKITANSNEDNSIFLFKLELKNNFYKVKVTCTDQYLMVITRLPFKPSEKNFNSQLSNINQNISVGYYHQDSEGFVTSRVSIGLKDSTASDSLVKECILRSLGLASKRIEEISNSLGLRIITTD